MNTRSTRHSQGEDTAALGSAKELAGLGILVRERCNFRNIGPTVVWRGRLDGQNWARLGQITPQTLAFGKLFQGLTVLL
jgi:hypothetical protein